MVLDTALTAIPFKQVPGICLCSLVEVGEAGDGEHVLVTEGESGRQWWGGYDGRMIA